ncbi:MAG: TonB-dependent receptor [Ferrovibrio sp.]|uniref:TonB-dependent receptor n=1 Tax=Ferrovibrio sp. TaxID=1917215 RepID=UPI00261D170E|nr:TonB-dependent receptor [Ferrovibrio sp.]MCW0233545.1 TonB-dependent receptor [Ferrovibrio sp.]
MTEFSGARARLAMILLASTVLTPAAVQAQSADIQVAQAVVLQSYSIPAGPLGAALTAFGERAGLRLLVSSELLAGRQSTAVTGQLTAEQALQRLLTGTGLTYRFTGNNGVTVVEIPKSGAATVLPPVTIEGRGDSVPSTAMIGNLPPAYAGGQVARGSQLGLLGNRDIMDTPFNTTTYTAKAMQDQQARTIADVLDNDPSVRTTTTRGSYDIQYKIRGFDVPNDDVAFNGLYGIVPRQTAGVEYAERVETLRGPSAMLGGIKPEGSVGGDINIVPKRAEDEPLTRLTFGYMSEANFGTHVDIGRRAGERSQYGLRFNGAYRNGETATDGVDQEYGLGAVGLDLRGERVRISLDAGYQAQNTTQPVGFINLQSGLSIIPNAPDASDSFLAPWSFAETRDLFGVVRGEVDLTDRVTAFAAFGARRSSNTTFGQAVYVDAAGNFGNSASSSQNGASYIYSEFNTLAGETGLRGDFETGDVKHNVSLAVNAARLENGYTFNSYTTTASNIYNPLSVTEPSHSNFSTYAPKLGEKTLQSIGLADTLSFFDDRIQWTVGGRLQRVNTINFVATGGQTTSFDERAFSPMTGLVVKPWETVSVYGNYIEGLSPGEKNDTTGLTNKGVYLAPYKTQQYEAGVKLDHGSFATTLSVFQISKPNGIIVNNTFTDDGEQRNRGIELSTFGSLTDDLRILGGVTYIKAEQTKTASGTNDGKAAIGVPETYLNLGVEYDTWFDRDLTLTARMIHTGSQYANAGNTLSIPSWQRFDIGARYRLETRGTPVTIRANIENLFDANYWTSTNRGFESLSLGAPRTFLLSASVDF